MELSRFVLSSFANGVWVMLRLVPVLVLVILALAAPALAIQNVWVTGTVVVIGATFGVAFYYVTGLRAGLMTLGLTDTPSFDALVQATLRQVFVFALAQFLVLLVMLSALCALYYYVVLPAVAPEAWAQMRAAAPPLAPEMGLLKLLLFLFPEAATGGPGAPELGLPAAVFVVISSAFASVNAGLFGVPMAANAANAVQHSPQNDLIFGFGTHFAGIFLVSFLATGLPGLVFQFAGGAVLGPLLFLSAGPSVALIAFLVLVGVVSLYLQCVPFAAMAQGYGLRREAIAAERAAEIRPVFDPEEHHETVRSLRRERQGLTAGTGVYVPERYRAGQGGAEEG